MRNIRDVPFKPLADKFGDRNLLREESKSGGRSRRSAHPSNHYDPNVESRAVKRGVDSSSPIPLEVRLAEARKAKESSARAKGSSATLATDPKVDKSSPAGDASVSDLLKMHFLSSPSACAELVDQIRQAGDLGTFSSLSLEKQREATLHLLQKGLNDLEKKDVELISKLSAEQTHYENKMSNLRMMISELKSSFVEKDSELSSCTADLASQKYAYFRLECKNADISLSYDKLLPRFRAYHKSAKESKSEAAMDAYKLGYLDCTNGNHPFYAIGDEDIEMLCPNLLPVQKAVAEKDGAEEDGDDEVVID
ncbi:unnamed protein product, partial [Prunus brigantina]